MLLHRKGVNCMEFDKYDSPVIWDSNTAHIDNLQQSHSKHCEMLWVNNVSSLSSVAFFPAR